ncbi:Peptidase E [Mannheimia varigena USDA-ARS-USMARC-1388]|uniref:dipeptidase E n=1 Tax=Mannheimia varigena USDA-ARS-USMARC-1296 TaxID=1433287 RepID=W0QBZ7_9PAST|nr:dipeptidase PepE [Mannheimia varigena]AHG75812.1 Peptidase E [Mannheimia varigena USDA-ARS-USMARC-1296]AHG79505.1 Peptidase E [Mannheimia varigena USDA-ARS-USMARC-1388]MDY2947424.1 dipeptidase PepE [Mannheimia varigena]TLU76404.1 dipeptidase PepE [Mannheimia varigena]
MKNMLLMSGSKYKCTEYLTHTIPWLKEFLADYKGKKVAFLPYAGVSRSYDEYEQTVQEKLAELELEIVSVHRAKKHTEIIEQADVIAIGGGNTFCLLNQMYENQVLECIREKVENGTPYFGWSAGANVAGSSIMTTNDMPITYPPSFNALNLFPHQINPHFISGKIQGHNGESREERLSEFLTVNPNALVYALPEGTALHIQDNQATALGETAILQFSRNMQLNTFEPNSIFTF